MLERGVVVRYERSAVGAPSSDRRTRTVYVVPARATDGTSRMYIRINGPQHYL